MAENNGSMWRKALVVLAVAVMAALSVVTIASAGSSGSDGVVRQQADGNGGEVVKAAHPRYCEGPTDAERGSIELAERRDAAEPPGGDIERAPKPGYCEQPVDAGQGDVEPRN